MCYAKPGPRCSNHTGQDLTKARLRYEASGSDEDKEAYDKAQLAYDKSPDGIRQLKEQAVLSTNPNEAVRLFSLAKEYEDEHRELIAIYKETEGAKASFKAFLSSLLPTALTRLRAHFNAFLAGKHTNSNKLAVLAADPNLKVRLGVAANEYTPAASLLALGKEQNPNLDAVLCLNGNTPSEVLRRIYDGGVDYHTKQMLRANPNTPTEILAELSKDIREDSFAKEALAGNPSTPVEVLTSLASEKKPTVATREALAGNSSTPAEVLTSLYRNQKGWRAETRTRVARALASNPSVSNDIRNELATHPDDDVRLAVVFNPKTQADTLDVLARDKNRSVRFFVLRHENTAEKTYALLANDSDPAIRVNAR